MKQNDEFRKPTKEDVLRLISGDYSLGKISLSNGACFYGMLIALEEERYAHFTYDDMSKFLAYGMAFVSPFYDTEEQIGHLTYFGVAIMVRSMHGIYFKLFCFKEGIFEFVAVLDV